MKCPNCGYECNEKFCSMCGTKMPEQPVQNNNTDMNFDNSDFNTGFNTAQPNNIPPAENPYNQNVPSMSIPQYTSPEQPKKKSKVLPIILIILFSVVILAGIGISIYSAIFHGQNITDNITDFITEEEPYENYHEDNGIFDDTTYKINENATFSEGTITLKEAKVVNDDIFPALDKKMKEWECTFEVTNTTDDNISFDYLSFTAYPLYKESPNYDGSLPYLYENIEYDDDGYITLEPGETKTVVFYFCSELDINNITIEVILEDYDDNYNYTTYFTNVK